VRRRVAVRGELPQSGPVEVLDVDGDLLLSRAVLSEEAQNTNLVPSGETSVGSSQALQFGPNGYVVSRLGSPPSEARTLKIPIGSSPVPHKRRSWSVVQTGQYRSKGAQFIVSSFEARAVGVHGRRTEREAAVARAVEPDGVREQEFGPIGGPVDGRVRVGRIDERHLLRVRPSGLATKTMHVDFEKLLTGCGRESLSAYRSIREAANSAPLNCTDTRTAPRSTPTKGGCCRSRPARRAS
jgi:hypothetical protein